MTTNTTNGKSQMISARIPHAVLSQAKLLMQREGCSLSQILTEAILFYAEHHQQPADEENVIIDDIAGEGEPLHTWRGMPIMQQEGGGDK